MDSASVSPETMQQLQNMSPQEKQQLNQFIQGENQKAQIQGVVHSLTAVSYTHLTLPTNREV